MKSKIVISPYSRKLRGKETPNPKNYPYWKEVVKGLKEKDFYIVQVGVEGEEQIEGVDEFIKNSSLDDLKILVNDCFIWISVDNFFGHLGNLLKKQGIVLFGKSDPEIFGHPSNINLLKDRSYLRKLQFDIWEAEPYDKDCFVNPEVVIETVLRKK